MCHKIVSLDYILYSHYMYTYYDIGIYEQTFRAQIDCEKYLFWA